MLTNTIYLHVLTQCSPPQEHCVSESPAVSPKAKHSCWIIGLQPFFFLREIPSLEAASLFPSLVNMDLIWEGCFSVGLLAQSRSSDPSESVTHSVLIVSRYTVSHDLLVIYDGAGCSPALGPKSNSYLKRSTAELTDCATWSKQFKCCFFLFFYFCHFILWFSCPICTQKHQCRWLRTLYAMSFVPNMSIRLNTPCFMAPLIAAHTCDCVFSPVPYGCVSRLNVCRSALVQASCYSLTPLWAVFLCSHFPRDLFHLMQMCNYEYDKVVKYNMRNWKLQEHKGRWKKRMWKERSALSNM